MTPASSQRPHSSAVAVERAADLLFLIAERGEVPLTELARSIGSGGSAVHRILTALKNKGLIQQATENGPYSMSWSILALTQRLIAQSDLRSLSLPHMTQLRDLTSETVTLNVRSGFERVCIDQVEGRYEVIWRQDIGKISPLFRGATGKALLAHLDPGELEEFWRSVEPKKLTSFTLTDRAELTDEIERIRGRGVAFSSQDRILGVSAVAAPIFDSSGRASATLTIAGPAERCTAAQLEEWAGPLLAATQSISQRLADASSGPYEPRRRPSPASGPAAGT